MAESKEELKSFLMEDESGKAGLKFNIQKTKIMASDPITSWQIDGEKMERVIAFNLGGGHSKITMDGDCSHDIKRHLLLGRKAMTNLDSILKSRYITLPTKVHIVKAMVFPIIMYSCESCERLLLNHANTPGFLAPGGEEFNPGPETRLDCSGLLCNKVLLKHKGDRESF